MKFNQSLADERREELRQAEAAPDELPVLYGLKNADGAWMSKDGGVPVAGIKPVMCALRDNQAMYGNPCTVEPLPTE